MYDDKDYSVRVLWQEPGAPSKWPHYIDSPPSLMRALRVAKNIRLTFGCSAWIEAFDQPANLPVLKVRQSFAEKKARLTVTS